MDPETHGVNMSLKNMSDFIELYFLETKHNMIC